MLPHSEVLGIRTSTYTIQAITDTQMFLVCFVYFWYHMASSNIQLHFYYLGFCPYGEKPQTSPSSGYTCLKLEGCCEDKAGQYS